GGSTPAASRGPDGELWFATSRGAATVLPSQVDQARLTVRPPSMVIEALEVDGTPVDVTERARIVPGTRHLEIAFAGLMLRAPDRIDYRYRLIGYDDEWSAPTRLRTAHYTNLDPGPYEFQVQAGVGGAWGEELATLAFHVEPHFYETRWFSGLVVATAFVLLWVGVRWRVADLRRRAQFLAREIADRTRALRDRTRQLEIANEEKLDLLRELERQSRAFERQAREDALTGLANRRRFDERMARAFKSLHNMESTKLAVAMLDIDHFKRINDTHSHQTGDAVLKVIGKELRRLEAEGLLAARYGGEEFALLFDNWSGPEAARRCERLRQTIESTVLGFIHPDLQVTISIGISDRTDLPNHEKMISDADDQLYLAKRAGRNRVYFDGRPVDSGPEEMATQSAD
ncbi:MAG: GGDEF domain-containing protein, partial [Xanthomonadales bacterium]|nr:GGDEF domain-containing protein [Xanthomonadales bacterium]